MQSNPTLKSPPSVSAGALDLQVACSFDAVAAQQEEWDRLVESLGGNIYMTFDWCRVWWEFYGSGMNLRIFLFRAQGSLAAVLPMYVDRIGFGPFRLTLGSLVGASIPPKVFDPPVRTEWAAAALSRTFNHLLAEDGCDLVSFGPVSERYEQAAFLFGRHPADDGIAGAVKDAVVDTHTVFFLPDTHEAYLEALSKNERKNRRKYELRLLQKDFDTRLEVLRAPQQVAEAFEAFVPQHALQWQAERRPGHFGAWPKALEYNRALVQTQGRLDRVRFIRILADEQVISSQYAFSFGERYTWELPSRAIGPAWERFSLGHTGLVTMIKAAIEEGKHRLEGGLGHYEYKLRLNAQEYPVHLVRVASRRRRTRFRLVTAGRAARCINWVYHKIWYRRVMPRLPRAFWRPLSRHVLRFSHL